MQKQTEWFAGNIGNIGLCRRQSEADDVTTRTVLLRWSSAFRRSSRGQSAGVGSPRTRIGLYEFVWSNLSPRLPRPMKRGRSDTSARIRYPSAPDRLTSQVATAEV